MKYGKELAKRSVPEWRSHNLEYNDVKQLIKAATIANRDNDGQETAAFAALYRALFDQFNAIDLFVKSKSGEIDRRTKVCEKLVLKLAQRVRRLLRSDGLSEGYTTEYESSATTTYSSLSDPRYQKQLYKLQQEVLKLSKDVQSLARFIGVQRTGFIKLVKKYAKWSKSSKLGDKFLPVLHSKDSFATQDFTSLFLELSLLYDVLRNPQSLATWGRQDHEDDNLDALDNNSLTKFDVEMATAFSQSITFWVHPDNILEVKVHLLQYLSLYSSQAAVRLKLRKKASRASLRGESNGDLAPLSRRDSLASSVDSSISEEPVTDQGEQITNVIYLDNARKLNSLYAEKEPGQIRWVSAPESVDNNAVLCAPTGGLRYFSFMQLTSKESSMALAGGSSIDELIKIKANAPPTSKLALSWIKNRNASAISKTQSNRERYFHVDGASNSSAAIASNSSPNSFNSIEQQGKIWASLDTNIQMWPFPQDTTTQNPEEDTSHTDFPYGVLEIRWKDMDTPEVVRELSNSHLLKKMTGFSFYAHSVATFHSDLLSEPPSWMQLLADGVDIRKTPKLSRRRTQPKRTDSSLDGARAGLSSLSAVKAASNQGILLNSSANSESDATMLTVSESHPPVVKYWNEFDDPEDGDNGVFIIPEKDDDEEGGFLSNTTVDFLVNLSEVIALKIDKFKSALGFSGGRSRHSTDSEESDDEDETNGLFKNRYSATRSPPLRAANRRAPGSYNALDDYDDEQNIGNDDEDEYFTVVTEKRNLVLTFAYSICLFMATFLTCVLLGVVAGDDMSQASMPTIVFTMVGFLFSLCLSVLGMCLFLMCETPLWWHQVIVFTLFFTLVCTGVGGCAWLISMM